MRKPSLKALRRFMPEEATLRRYLPDVVLPRALRPADKAQESTTAEEFLYIDRPRDSILWLRDGAGVKILEVHPVNLNLRTEYERAKILAGEKELLNALPFPVQRLIHAEPVDLTDYIGKQMEDLARLPHGRRRELFQHHLDYLQRLVKERKLVRWRRLLILYHEPGERALVAATLEKRAQTVQEGLKDRCGLLAQSLDSLGIARMLDALFDPDRALASRLQHIDIEDVAGELAVPLDFTPDNYFHLGNRFARVYMVTGYPHMPGEGWLNDLYQWNPAVSISQHLEPALSSKLTKDLNNTIKEVQARLEGELSPDKRKVEEQRLEDADRLLGEITVGNHRVLDVAMYLQVTAPSLDDLERLGAELEGYLIGKHITVRLLKWTEMKQGFWAMLPYGRAFHSEAHRHQIPASGVATLFPWSNAELVMGSGRFRGINAHTQNVVVQDPEALPNPHEVVLAYTGGGKSVEMHLDMLHRWAAGRRVLCLDPERDKGHLCRACGGQLVRLRFGSGNIINPMQARRPPRDPDLDDDDEQAEESCNALQAQILRQRVLLSLLLPDVTVEELAYTSDVMMELYAERGITLATDPVTVPAHQWPTWNELQPALASRPETRRLGMVLKDWTTGPFAGVFNGHTTVQLDADFVVLDIADFKMNPYAQRPVFYMALTYLWDEIDRDWDAPKDLFCDEVGILVDTQGALKGNQVDMALWFLWMVSKCARKRNCRLKAATQNPDDFLAGGSYARGILENCHTVVLGLLTRTAIDRLRQVVELSDAEQARLLAMSPAEKLFIVGRDRALVQVVASDEEMDIADRRRRQAKQQQTATR